MLYVRRPRGEKIPSGKGMSLLAGVSMDEQMLPKFDFYLDESDPDVVVLRRQDGTFVAAFSASGATREGIIEAAKEDYGRLVEAYAAWQQSHRSPEGQRGNRSA
jgi:hypothetical protein